MAGTSRTLTGPEARAVAVAVAEFTRTGAAVERFEVDVVAHPDTVEVAFVPPQPTDGPTVRGGSTPAGREIHYWVSRDAFTVVRTSLAR